MKSTAIVQAIQENIGRVIKGKPRVIELTVVTLLARGHLLLEDVPGVGKTTLAHSLARSLDCSFKRIQFTSDLLPSDIVGVSLFNRQKQAFEFMPGPIFANIVLADEINRTTPKTQSSLLEAMSEAQISVDNQTHPLHQPFMVIATQNPAEDLQPVVSARDVLDLQHQVDQVLMEESLTEYLLAIVQATRQTELLSLGVSTRGALALSRAAKALAFVRGRAYCLPDDIKELAPVVLSHRIMLSRSQGLHQRNCEQTEQVVHDLVESVPVPV